ncbi:MAG: FHA domain-containing protein [Butyrivibrio sp.]|uniref:FHA domain-containing protein n=1 Tax=Butyrivibrio sp. TaxID=28121 RepID=UPI001B151306|nr:FHA domain-containing protein [Butyrivibrio sp.]MBO6240316.1 FHA domain-containing protein [Butyrivibrio sp.]
MSKEKIHEDEILEEKHVRICICGKHNPPNARKCDSCGEDISTFTVVKASSASEEKAINGFSLESIDGDYRFIPPEGNTKIGREEGMKEYFAGKRYVGRIHAELIKTEDQLFIRDLHSTNHVYVNNEEIPVEKQYEVHVGDEIGIGGKVVGGNRQSKAAYFIVKACD